MTEPKISVITVSYNAADTIEDTIKSVLAQKFAAVEYILIDGASTDQTVAIIRKYDHKISHWVTEPDQGIYDAMNKGLTMASGDWVFFLGADDVFYNERILAQLAQYMVSKDKIYFGDAYFKDSRKVYHKNASKWALCLHNISHQSIFYPRVVYKQFKYDLNYPVFADHIYNIRLLGGGYFEMTYVPLTISIYNDKGRSAYTYDNAYFNDLPQIVKETLGKKYALYVSLRLFAFKLKRKIRHEI